WIFLHSPGVSLNFTQAPLRQVLRAFEKQAPVRVQTNIDPETLITIYVQNAPWPDALETIAVAAEGRWSPGYVLAPSREEARSAIADWRAGTLPEGWRQFTTTGGGWMMPSVADLAYDGERLLDPRHAIWPIQEVEPRELHRLLDQGRFLTEASFWAPGPWNPTLSRLPKTGSVRQVAQALAREAGGVVEEFIILAARPSWTGGPQAATTADRSRSSAPGETTRNRSGNQPLAAPEQIEAWRQLKLETDLAALPADRRTAVRNEIETFRTLFEEIRSLPPEERRERMTALMDNPAIQERMEQREAARDARRSPEQRLQRYQRYVDRKRQMAQAQP
ncbi:MAG: hypothetical protein SNJ84_07605, partial [Verrucomicrobiia bacterium]